MIQLHYYPGTAAMAPHILLEELGIAYQRMLARPAVSRVFAAEEIAAPWV